MRFRTWPFALIFIGMMISGCNTSGTIFPCQGIDCSEHGVCLTYEGSPRCECDPGYVEAVGFECIEEASSPCADIQCQANASCKVDGQQGTCECNSGYHLAGSDCVKDSDPCHDIDCGQHGSCLAVNGAPTCACDAGWHPDGLACVEDIDPCQDVDCGEHGSCAVSGGEPTCACDAGWHPDGLACVEDDPCLGINCIENAHCELGSCVCDSGYHGDPLVLCEEYVSEEDRVRQLLVSIAEAEIGMCEGSDERPYMEWQPGLWCFDFVSWVYTQADEGLRRPDTYPRYYVNEMPVDWRPKPGDLIKYTYQHYAMVAYLSEDETIVHTIEGNVNSCVMRRATSYDAVEFYGSLEGQIQ
jgi:growth factor-like EGF protein